VGYSLAQSKKKAVLEGIQKQRRQRTMIAVVIVAVLIAVIVGGIYTLTQNTNLVRQDIPNGVGIAGSCIRPLHTHDGTGTIHAETDEDRDYTLNDFFRIWDKSLNSSGIFRSTQPLPSYLDRCLSEATTLLYHAHPTLTIFFKKDAPSTITMTVNGNAEPLLQNYVLPRNTPAAIEITYGPGVTAQF